ncbi:MAG: hypothetical protein ABI862_18670, partial [Ilumatobacteraceae bacterium]
MGETASANRWWPFWVVVVAGVFATHLIDPDGILGNVTYLVATGGAAILAWVGVRHQPPPRRFTWGCIAVGVTSSAAGDFIYYISGQITGTLADVSVADAFWLVSYVALAVGLSSLIVGGRGLRRIDVDGLIDIASFAVLAMLVVTQFGVVRDIVNDTSYSV